jgi:hypothetical protein
MIKLGTYNRIRLRYHQSGKNKGKIRDTVTYGPHRALFTTPHEELDQRRVRIAIVKGKELARTQPRTQQWPHID